MLRAFSSPSFVPWLVAMLLALAEIHSTTIITATRQKKVLVLYSTRRDAQIVAVAERELPRVLEAGLHEGIDYYSEYIDRGRFPDPDYQESLREFLHVKYQGQQFDVIIAMNDLSLSFLGRNRNELFPGVPIVFFGRSATTKRVPNSTGLLGLVDFSGTLDLAMQLQPDIRHVFIVSGAEIGDREYAKLAREQFGPYESRVAITYLEGLPTTELEARLKVLPPHSIVYYVVVNRDGAGEYFHPLEYLDRLTALANAPMYSWVDSTLGHGVLGGYFKSQKAEAAAVAHLAVKVLRGEPADSIPVGSFDSGVDQVDWRQLRRWGISEGQVPPEVVVSYREPSLLDRYRFYIVGAAALMLAQTALIAGLLVLRTRRQQAETRLRASQAELQTSYERIRDLGGRLLNAHENERSRIARELHDDISQQMALLTMDLDVLGSAAQGEPKRMAQEALTLANRIARSVHDLSYRLHPAKLRLIGLVSAINALQHELSQPEMPITFTHDRVPSTLPSDVTLCLFRIVQEALQNAVKYSRARQVAVQLTGGPDGLDLTVVDDGVGFDVNAAWGLGLGLVSMSERLEAIGGQFEIRSAPGAGTLVRGRVPLEITSSPERVAV